MTNKAAEFLVLFLVKLAAALVESHRRRLKDEKDLAEFEAKIESAKAARTRQDKQNAAGEITESN